MLRSRPIQRTQELDKTWELLSFRDDPPIHYREGGTVEEMARVIESHYIKTAQEPKKQEQISRFWDNSNLFNLGLITIVGICFYWHYVESRKRK